MKSISTRAAVFTLIASTLAATPAIATRWVDVDISATSWKGGHFQIDATGSLKLTRHVFQIDVDSIHSDADGYIHYKKRSSIGSDIVNIWEHAVDCRRGTESTVNFFSDDPMMRGLHEMKDWKTSFRPVVKDLSSLSGISFAFVCARVSK